MRNHRYLVGMAVLAFVLLSGCSDRSSRSSPTATGAGQPTKDTGVVFRRGIAGEPDSLDPHRSEEASTADVIRDLYEGLTTESPEGAILPGVAERWEVSGDGRAYTFHLRSDAYWSNGDPVTAGDFEAGLRRSADPATGSAYSLMLAPIENAEAILAGDAPPEMLGVTARSDRVLEIRLKAPTPYFLGMLSHSATYPIHGPSLEEHGNEFARAGKLVSNGAFMLDEWVVQSHLRLRKNEQYWDAANVTIDTIYYYSIEEPGSELKRYRADELDFTESIPNTRFDWIRENLGDELRVSPYLGVYYYTFNITRPPFDDTRLRTALSMAVDRAILTEKVIGIGELPAFGFIPPGVRDYGAQSAPWAGLDDADRLAKARALYAAAGYGPDNPLRVQIFYNTGDNHKKIALAVAAMWKQGLGVEAEPINEELRVLLDHRKDRSRWEVMRLGWVGDYDDAYTFLEIMHSGHGQNDSGYADREYDRLVEAASIEADPARRRELLEAAERTMLEHSPIMPLYFYVTKRLVKPWVSGYRPSILDHNYSRYLSIDTEARGF